MIPAVVLYSGASGTQNLNLTPKKSREKKKTNSVFVSEFVFFICGGDKGIRTPDLCIANASLYQLSHIPMPFFDYQYIVPHTSVKCK